MRGEGEGEGEGGRCLTCGLPAHDPLKERYREIQGDSGRYREIHGDLGRYGEIWGDVGETWGDLTSEAGVKGS